MRSRSVSFTPGLHPGDLSTALPEHKSAGALVSKSFAPDAAPAALVHFVWLVMCVLMAVAKGLGADARKSVWSDETRQ